MTYKDGYDKIINKYAELKEEIEAKEITETYTAEMKAEELAENEEAKKKELEQYDADYVKAMEDIKNTQPVDYIYIETKIENIDFVAPEPIDLETANLEKVMTALPETIYNTKYIYLTLDNKYEAIKKLEDEEYAKYEESFNNVVSVYKTQANEINNKYDDLKAQIEAKQITETYTAEMKAEELAENEEARDNELKINEDSKAEEIHLVNNDYAVNSSKIAIALTQLKSDKETGFIGDVHIHGKLHVDTNVNIEGNINNIPVSDYLTKVDKIELTQLLDNKANTSHTHNIEDITDYEPYDDTEIRTLINSKSDNSHTHTNFNKVNITNSAGPTKWNYDIVAIKPNMEEGNYNLFYIGKTREKYISGYFGYRHSETDPRMTIGIHSADDLLTIGITQANIKPALTCDNTITATNIKADNETRLKAVEETVNNKSDVEHTHTEFTKINVSDSGDPTTWTSNVETYKENMREGDYNLYYAGKTSAKDTSGYIGYKHSETDPRMTIGLHSTNDLLTVGKENVNIKPSLTCDDTITATNIKADNETRLKAVESNIINDRNKLVSLRIKNIISTPSNNVFINNSNNTPIFNFIQKYNKVVITVDGQYEVSIYPASVEGDYKGYFERIDDYNVKYKNLSSIWTQSPPKKSLGFL